MLTLTRQNATLKKNALIMSYKIIDDLFYFDDDERSLRLYMLIIIKIEVFKLTHNEIRCFNYAYIYKRFIEELYIFNIITKLHKFMRHYPHCQLNQISRYKLYDFLQSIFSSIKPFYILIIDFILTLSKSLSLLNEYDCILSIINKFFKIVTFIFDKII